jgi:hypothetical protein
MLPPYYYFQFSTGSKSSLGADGAWDKNYNVVVG